jgi:hypothetical protein
MQVQHVMSDSSASACMASFPVLRCVHACLDLLTRFSHDTSLAVMAKQQTRGPDVITTSRVPLKHISISEDPKVFGTKVEVKNINSFRAMERAAEYETKRMIKLLEEGKGDEIVQETQTVFRALNWKDIQSIEQTCHHAIELCAQHFRLFLRNSLLILIQN